MSSKKGKKLPHSRPSSPVYLHVDKDTPVHLYVEKDDVDKLSSYSNSNNKNLRYSRPKKPGTNILTSKLMKKPKSNDRLNRLRSMSPPWVPPPGKTTKAGNPSGLGPYWNDNEANFSQQERYEQQINDLLGEVGDLREQLEMEQLKEEARKGREESEAQVETIEELKQEMDVMEKENQMLRDNFNNNSSKDSMNNVVSLLIDTELAAQSSEHQMQYFFDNMKNILVKDHKVTDRDIERISTLLHDSESRFYDFQTKSEQLRLMLQTEARNSMDPKVLERELLNKQQQVDEMYHKLAKLEQDSLCYTTNQQSLESVRGHLQQQLRQKSGDCNRMAVQIRTLENELAKERLDKEHLVDILRGKDKKGSESDRDALKRAARAQKQRALKAEETIHELSAVLAEKESQIEQLMTKTKDTGEQFDKSIECNMDSHEDQLKLRKMGHIIEENEQLYDKLSEKEHDRVIVGLKRENESLRSIADECEARLKQVEHEMQILRESLGDESEARSDDQVDKLNRLVEKLEASEKYNRDNLQRIENLEKKNRSLEAQNSELKNNVQNNESNNIDSKSKVEDLMRENASLMRQLEAALIDSKRSNENNRDKSQGQERSIQTRIHDLETQLAQQRADAAKWRRNSEEIERKCNSRLQDVQVQLEQAERTNNSLQTYVQFLKKSYANVFGDLPTLTNGSTKPLGSFGFGQTSMNFGTH